MRINTLRGNTLAEHQEKRAVRLWDSYRGLWWRLCYKWHLKKQAGQSVTEYTPRSHAVSGGSLVVTPFMVWFPKCITSLFLTLALARLLGVKFFEKIMGYCSSMISFPFLCPWKIYWILLALQYAGDSLLYLAVADHGTLCEGLTSHWLLLISDVKCTNRSTWYLLAHLCGIGTTPCSCLGIAELPQMKEVGALQSQAAPWSGEQQGCFSSATFVLPLLGMGRHMLQALWCQYSG